MSPIITIRTPPPTPPDAIWPMIEPISSPPAPAAAESPPPAEQCPDDLRAHTAANDPRDRIADSAQIILLQRRAGDVSAHRTRDQLDDQPDDSTPHCWLLPIGSPS